MKSQHFIFYGTLCDPDILSRVCSPETIHKFWKSMNFPGYQTVYIKNASYPGLLATPNGSFRGDLYCNLTMNEIDALIAYEDEEYVLHTWMVENQAFQIFIPKSNEILTDKPWFFEDWQKSAKKGYIKEMTQWLR